MGWDAISPWLNWAGKWLVFVSIWLVAPLILGKSNLRRLDASPGDAGKAFIWVLSIFGVFASFIISLLRILGVDNPDFPYRILFLLGDGIKLLFGNNKIIFFLIFVPLFFLVAVYLPMRFSIFIYRTGRVLARQVMPPILRILIDDYRLRWKYFLLGVAVFICGLTFRLAASL